jgi:hypothetical protein
MTSGRNFDEVLRLLDSIQLTAKHMIATPVDWKQGDDVIIAGSVSDEQAREKFPGGWKALKPYLRIGAAALVAEPKKLFITSSHQSSPVSWLLSRMRERSAECPKRRVGDRYQNLPSDPCESGRPCRC